MHSFLIECEEWEASLFDEIERWISEHACGVLEELDAFDNPKTTFLRARVKVSFDDSVNACAFALRFCVEIARKRSISLEDHLASQLALEISKQIEREFADCFLVSAQNMDRWERYIDDNFNLHIPTRHSSLQTRG